ncbi:MAG: response regulator [Lachnospiraceae bacterium]|nr:response regulator [Lachnospiraceae bacterium]
MTNIIVVFPRLDEGKNIRNILVRSGFDSVMACSTASQALGYAEETRDGVVVSGYKLPDMVYDQLREELPKEFEMLLVASGKFTGMNLREDVETVTMPLKVQELVDRVRELTDRVEAGRRARRGKPRERTREEMEAIERAKELLSLRRGYSEAEAHRYLQKTSMDSGTNLVEAAYMVIAMFAPKE